MTATGDGQTKGGAENVKQNSNSKDKLEGEQKVEPGSLADRPMGDAPPPKNEELADDVAPTFEARLLTAVFQQHQRKYLFTAS